MRIQDKDYILEYNYNAIADIEEKAGKGITKLFSEDVIGFNVLRLLVWGGLIKNNPRIIIQTAGNLIEKYVEEGNSTSEMMDEIMTAMQKNGFMGKQEPGEV
jgi:hypothetical protein